MRTFLVATLIALAFLLPVPASATDAPLPPAIMCVQYRATAICILMGDDQAVWSWTTPWYSGVTAGPPIPWPAN